MPRATSNSKTRHVLISVLLFGTSFVFTFGYLQKYGEVHNVTRAETLVPAIADVISGREVAQLIFVGDIMLDRTIRRQIERQGGETLFKQVKPLFATPDLVAGNLEGPITAYPSVSLEGKVGEPNNTRFTFDPSIAPLLRDMGFDLVSLGNNHISDFGREGARSTRAYLEGANIAYVGDPFDPHTVLVWEEVGSMRIAFVGYNEFILPDPEGVRVAVSRARKEGADFVVVMAHWGEEYTSTPPARVRQLAATFAAAGADLIIGTHSHVIGEIEDMGETRVYYSLGNFIFDQYWDDSVRCGIAVEVVLVKRARATTSSYRTHETYLERDGSTTLGCPLSQTQDTPN